MSQYIIFTVEFLLLLGLLWYVFRVRYFGSLFITSAVLLPLGAVAFNYLVTNTPEILYTPAFRFVAPYWKQGLQKATMILPLILAGVVVLYGIVFLFYRVVYKKVSELLYKFKIRMFHQEDTKMKRLFVDVQKYINQSKDGNYFLGLTQRAEQVYIAQEDLTTHIQVVGPSGCGKTVSVLFPLAVQTLIKGKALIFVDGKGDSKLKQMLQKFCASKNIPMLFFDPLQPQYSNSYNPLCSSKDADEIAGLLAIGLNLDAPGEAKVYTDIQKKFLATLLHLFMATGQRFNFIDIIEFIDHEYSRNTVYDLLPKDNFYKDEMKVFLMRLSKNLKELIGMSTIIDQWFVSDPTISEIVNTYQPDIDISTILKNKGAVLFSFSAGKKANTNEALAKMVLADIFNSVGERHASVNTEHDFAMIILDEFGQYVSEKFDKFISTARSANISCILSHQTNAQLEVYRSDKLARVVRENTTCKIIFRQSEEASFWAECFGTKPAVKRTEQVETGRFLTEKVSKMGSLREVDEFIIHPNKLRQLETGQAVFKFKSDDPVILSTGIFPVPDVKIPERLINRSFGEGLNLRQRRLADLKNKQQEQNIQQKEVSKKDEAIFPNK
ncbi:MAG: TraM recognition domain-containing protein [Elusimicrobiota bacterium]|nr:TraM recognition domain-containing protein [Elusimicrobiota bacterium]